jgi:hypothetical protein
MGVVRATGRTEIIMSDEPKRLLFARKSKWCDPGGELHPLMALRIVALILVGVPLLAWALAPWTGAIYRRLFG